MFFSEDFQNNGNGFDDNIDINITNTNMNTNTNQNYNMGMMDNQTVNFSTVQGPIIEPGRERVIQRNIIHEVKHVCPMNTRIINNHIFKHTYQPHYTCCEENTCTNVQCGSCCNFN